MKTVVNIDSFDLNEISLTSTGIELGGHIRTSQIGIVFKDKQEEEKFLSDLKKTMLISDADDLINDIES